MASKQHNFETITMKGNVKATQDNDISNDHTDIPQFPRIHCSPPKHFSKAVAITVVAMFASLQSIDLCFLVVDQQNCFRMIA